MHIAVAVHRVVIRDVELRQLTMVQEPANHMIGTTGKCTPRGAVSRTCYAASWYQYRSRIRCCNRYTTPSSGPPLCASVRADSGPTSCT